jgi:hypothetical protein
VLPYMEQGAIHELYRFDRDWDHPDNAGAGRAIRQSVPNFVCPSAPKGNRHPDRGLLDYAATTERTAPSNVNPFMTPVPPGDSTYIGVLGNNVKRKFVQVLDGTSNTIMLAECAGRNRRFIMGQEYAQGTWTNGPWANPGSRINMGGYDPSVVPLPDLSNLPAVGPCAVNCINDKEIYAFHAGGAMLLMTDGAARFVKQNITLNTAVQMLTRARNETIGEDPY